MKQQFALAMVAAFVITSVDAGWRDQTNQSHHGKERFEFGAPGSFFLHIAGAFNPDRNSGWTLWCPGAYIARKWVVTAAHCLNVGGTDRTRKLAIFVPYPNPGVSGLINGIFEYPRRSLQTDIALLRLILKPNFTSPIRLPRPGDDDKFIDSGLNVSIHNYLAHGYHPNGSRDDSNYTFGSTARSYSQLKRGDCHSGLYYPFDFTRQVCTLLNETDGIKYCYGDSGSPAVAMIGNTPVLLAIISYITYNCNSILFKNDVNILMTVLLRIEAFMPWILHIITNNSKDHGLENIVESWKDHPYQPS